MSHHSQPAHDPAHDTIIGPDRRLSPRAAIAGPVRMGPAHGDPYATVSASDLSRNGLFIDADRPVKVGARFSAEIELEAGEVVYIPEAEVAYNREGAAHTGFGVRFVDPPDEAVRRIDDAIARTIRAERRVPPTVPPSSSFEIVASTPASAAPAPAPAPSALDPGAFEATVMRARVEVEPAVAAKVSSKPLPESSLGAGAARGSEWGAQSRELDGVSPDLPAAEDFDPDGATEVPARVLRRSLRLDLSQEHLHEPELSEDALSVSLPPDAEPGAHETPRLRAWMENAMQRARDTRHRAIERARRFPPLWTGVATAGLATVALGVGLAMWMGTSAEAVPAASREDRGITATTHQVLMGGAQQTSIEEPARAPAKGAAEEPAAEVKRPLPPLVVVDASSPSVVKKPELEPAEPEIPLVAPPKVAAKVDAEVKAEAPARGVVPAKATPAQSTAAVLTARIQRDTKPVKDGKAKLRIGGVAPGAAVLRTHVLRAPDRFVIDLTGQVDAPSFPAAQGKVKNIRFGKHPGHVRVVIETTGRIEQGFVTKSGKELSVSLDLVR